MVEGVAAVAKNKFLLLVVTLLFIFTFCETSSATSKSTKKARVAAPIPTYLSIENEAYRELGFQLTSAEGTAAIDLDSGERFAPKTLTSNLVKYTHGFSNHTAIIGYVGYKNAGLCWQYDFPVTTRSKYSIGAMVGGDKWELHNYGMQASYVRKPAKSFPIFDATTEFTPYVSAQLKRSDTFLSVSEASTQYSGANDVVVREKSIDTIVGVDISFYGGAGTIKGHFLLMVGYSHIFGSNEVEDNYPANYRRGDARYSGVGLGLEF